MLINIVWDIRKGMEDNILYLGAITEDKREREREREVKRWGERGEREREREVKKERERVGGG